MKKTLFLLAAAAISTACSMDETTEVNQGLPIDFRTAVATRTTESNMNTTDNLKKINVTALDSEGKNYFSNQDFEKKEVETTFTNENNYPWPAGELTFYAYAPTPLTGTESVNITNDSKTVEFTVQNKISKQVDFITATATGSKEKDVNGMPLEFGHRLSQIEIQAKVSESATKFSYTVTGVKIANVAGTGTFNFDTEEWTDQSTNTTYTTTYETDEPLTTTAESIMGNDGNAMLIPQTFTEETAVWNGKGGEENNKGAYLAVKIEIKEKSAGDGIDTPESIYDGWAAVPLPDDTNWEAGKKYTYTLTFTDTAAGKTEPTEDGGGEEILDENYIDFNVTVSEEWEETTTPLLGDE